MERKGLRQERETIINFNEVDETASIWTASGSVYDKLLKRLGRAYLTEDGERHAIFVFPLKFLRLPVVRKKRALDPIQKQALADQLAKHRESRAARR